MNHQPAAKRQRTSIYSQINDMSLGVMGRMPTKAPRDRLAERLLQSGHFRCVRALYQDGSTLQQEFSRVPSDFSEEEFIYAMSFSPDGEKLASAWSGMSDFGVRIMRTSAADSSHRTNQLYVCSGHSDVVTNMCWLKSDHAQRRGMLLSCGLDGKIGIYTESRLECTLTDHADWLRCLATPYQNDDVLLSGCVSSNVYLWSLEKCDVSTRFCVTRSTGTSSNQKRDQQQMNTVNSLCFAQNPNIFVVATRDGQVKIYDARCLQLQEQPASTGGRDQRFSGSLTGAMPPPRSSSRGMGQEALPYAKPVFEFCSTIVSDSSVKMNCASLSPDDLSLLTSSRDSTVRIWDMRKLPQFELDPVHRTEQISTSLVRELKYGHQNKTFNASAQFLCGDRFVLCGSEDGAAVIYDNSDRREANDRVVARLTTGGTVHLAMAPNQGNRIATANMHNRRIQIWEPTLDGLDKDSASSIPEEPGESEDSWAGLQRNLMETLMTQYGDQLLSLMHQARGSSMRESVDNTNMLDLIGQVILSQGGQARRGARPVARDSSTNEPVDEDDEEWEDVGSDAEEENEEEEEEIEDPYEFLMRHNEMNGNDDIG